MKIFYHIFIIALCLITSLAYATDDDSQKYYRAYNICSPSAHQKTMQQCNYSKMVENSYINCMHKSGYSENDNASAPNYYDGYMKAHNACTLTANKEAQIQCNYGSVYQVHYNACMLSLGFNASGESILNKPQTTASEEVKKLQDAEEKEPAKNENTSFGTKIRRIFDMAL